MKRNMDLVREILLQIEERDQGQRRWVELTIPEHSESEVVEHLFLLHETGLIEGNDTSSIGERDFKARRLTAAGHDFLDSVRDPKIWKKAKDGAEAAGGFSLGILGDIAKGLIKTQIKKATGVEV